MPATSAVAVAPRRLQWMTATVRDVIDETPRVRSLVLDVPDWPGHRAGQHVDVRLTAEDGYQAQRSYSIASAPATATLTLTVERLAEGEVSPYLAGEARTGDQFELRGPIGGYFVWTPDLGGPLFLVAGGSGVVPLMAMLRQRAAVQSTVPATLLYSSRSLDDIIYRAELERLTGQGDGLKVVHTLTRERPSRLERARAPDRPRHAGKRRLCRRPPIRAFSCAGRRRWWRPPRAAFATSATSRI